MVAIKVKSILSNKRALQAIKFIQKNTFEYIPAGFSPC